MDSAADDSSCIQPSSPSEKENEATAPPLKRPRLSLSLKKKEPPLKERFVSPSKTNSVYEKAAEGVIPSNTRANTNWCIRTIKTWLEQRNIRTAENPECAISPDILESHDVDAILGPCICLF